jgi:cytochrome c553
MNALPRLALVTVVALGVMTLRPDSRPLAAPAPDTPPLPARLSETGLYEASTSGRVAPENRPFSPQYPLWSDGARKLRWVYLPPGTAIDAQNDTEWRFPIGTRFWKEFRVGDRKVETRMLWRASSTKWMAASYLWNAEQTDAVLAPAAGVPNVAEVAPGRRHSIPSQTDCLACHGTKQTTALGFNLLQLSTDRDPNAIHGEPLEPGMITLASLINEGRLSPASSELVRQPPRIATRHPLTRTMLGYFSANCGSCHNGGGEIAAMGPSLRFSNLLRDGDAVAAQLVGHLTSWQVPGVAEGESVLIDLRVPERSAMLVRMRSRRPSSQMPPLGTVVRDEAAIDGMNRWLNELSESGLELTTTRGQRRR